MAQVSLVNGGLVAFASHCEVLGFRASSLGSGQRLAQDPFLSRASLSAEARSKKLSVAETTAADGSFSLKRAPRSLTFYRARFAGDGAEYSAAVSGVRYAKPRAWVSNPIAPYYMYRHRSRLVYGYLMPRHVAGARPVRIYRYRYEGGRWVSYGYVLARAYDYATYTKYAVYTTLPRRGLWRLRAYHPADEGHAASWSSGHEYARVR